MHAGWTHPPRYTDKEAIGLFGLDLWLIREDASDEVIKQLPV